MLLMLESVMWGKIISGYWKSFDFLEYLLPTHSHTNAAC